MFFAAIISCIALVQASIIPVEVHHPQPYKFGYSVKDHHSEQHREEAGNGAGGVVGNYGFTDARGIARQVNYVADHAGFRAQVKTNEPGTANQNPAAVQVISDAPYANVAAAPIVAQPAAVVVPTVVDASPVLDARYAGLGYGAGYAGLGYGAGYSGLGYGAGYAGHGYRGYGLGNLGYANGGALVNTGLLGVNGGFVNIPLLGGNVRGYDSRFVNLAL
ncbi:cuticle protein 16.8 [Trichonephila inaurata madagascariensis]|uniref:Cuticle protein 16.8 n=2 Tax=Trichonephila inaurata madagascariensis TaxID=2747483 RepID=A0A8X7CR09_9ARAC|nr:cuticle protein 16.8 [Trichonephila inaurata madagascariensis]